MISTAAQSLAGAPRGAGWRLALPLGLTLAGLWMIELHPAAGSVLAPLNVLTARLTAAMLGVVGLSVVREAAVLTHAQGFAWEIYHACTALTPVALLTAAIAPCPAPPRVRIIGVLAGAALLFAVNQARLVSLVWLGVYAPDLFYVAHAMVWPALLTLATAGYWFAWVKAAHR